GGGDFSFFFLRARSIKDHRYKLGKTLENGSFILNNDEFSGEKDCLCTCYEEYELVEYLKEYLNLYDFEVIMSENINVKNKIFIKDSDIIVYGKIK
ncbi:class I SAM-dependent methyltransferase, partial [Campylobacter novaezeelandiae]